MELQLNRSNQYSKRSNIKMSRISENIQQQELENHVIDVLPSTGIKVVSYDSIAVHRLSCNASYF